jgi:alpha-L-fucosidase
VATLDAIGEWMRLHNRSVYDTTQSDFAAPPDCRFTQRGNRLYLHVFAWPMVDIHLDGLADRVEYAQLLNDGSEVQMSTGAGKEGYGGTNTLTLELPIQRPDVLVPVVELFLKED